MMQLCRDAVPTLPIASLANLPTDQLVNSARQRVFFILSPLTEGTKVTRVGIL